MTSQKSSVNKHDFMHAAAPFSVAIAYFVVMCIGKFIYNPISALIHDEVISYGDIGSFNLKEISTCLLTDGGDGFALAVSFAFIGLLFAIASFKFATRKNAVNFFFSAPISRKDLFKNRVVFSISITSVILAVSIFIDAVINIVYLGNPMYIIKLALLLYAECMVYFTVSYAIFSIGICSAYTVFEGMIFGAGLYFFPLGITVVVDGFCSAFLRGYSRPEVIWSVLNGVNGAGFVAKSLMVYTANLNPLFLGKAFGAEEPYENIMEYCHRVNYSGTKPEAIMPDINYIIPIIIWAVVAVALIFIARYCFVNRKAENVALHASNKWINAFFCTELALGSAGLVGYGFSESNVGLRYLLIFAVPVIVFYISYSISIRSIIKNAKGYATGACVGVLCLLVSAVLALGGFGYSSYVPDAKDVEMAAIAGIGVDPKAAYIDNAIPICNYDENGLVMVTDEEDINAFVEAVGQFVSAKNNDSKTNIKVVYSLKNGKKICRAYNTSNTQSLLTLLSLTDTKAYNQELRYLLTGEGESAYKDVEKYGFNPGISEFIADYVDEYTIRTIFEKADVKVAPIGTSGVKIDNTIELRKAIADDFEALSYKDIYSSDEDVVCTINFGHKELFDEAGDYNEYAYTFQINTNMTKTLAVIGDSIKDIKAFDGFELNNAYMMTYKDYLDYYSSIGYGYYYMHLFNGGFFESYDEYTKDDNYYQDCLNPENVFAKGKQIDDNATLQKYSQYAQAMRFADDNDYVVVFSVKDKDGKDYYLLSIITQKDMLKLNS